MKILTIRASSLDHFNPCPRQFAYSNFRKDIPGIGHPNAALGIAVHAGIAQFWENKRAHREDPMQGVSQATMQALKTELAQRPYDGADPSKLWSRALFLVNWYGINHEFESTVPVATEAALELWPIDGIKLTGHPDLILRDPRVDYYRPAVVDHKVRRQAMGPGEVGGLMQLTAYAYLMGLGWYQDLKGRRTEEMLCRVDNIVLPKEEPGKVFQAPPKMQELPTVRNLDHLAEMTDFLEEIVERGDDLDNYPARPTPLCQACSYRAVCHTGQRYLERQGLPLFHDIEMLPGSRHAA